MANVPPFPGASASLPTDPISTEENSGLGFLQLAGGDDPVEAYFECISQCSLDDGECVTVCTTILRDQS